MHCMLYKHYHWTTLYSLDSSCVLMMTTWSDSASTINNHWWKLPHYHLTNNRLLTYLLLFLKTGRSGNVQGCPAAAVIGLQCKLICVYQSYGWLTTAMRCIVFLSELWMNDILCGACSLTHWRECIGCPALPSNKHILCRCAQLVIPVVQKMHMIHYFVNYKHAVNSNLRNYRLINCCIVIQNFILKRVRWCFIASLLKFNALAR